ncbi:MAG: hypothetical protein JSW48_06535 [Betaproteobacteria bacterium]|jgi:hypothetical protein|nr:MAG: hypothetical protein JSW48_06535 [Betaproteobacteria bacterium]
MLVTTDVEFTISDTLVFRFHYLPEDDVELQTEVIHSSKLRFERRTAANAAE